ncbi:mitochondrial fission process protein 1 [Willisornis vidua]|uniref:Mitochondrial fission process protein 1 n=1 Tax=Willisornis vidua TaxID=1566151 RepID=A0ABQ9DQN3_9PASS|nr:mitochondrial fission process protein 1 [Willisornis vidua]
MQQENHGVVTIIETWWDDSYDWSAAVDSSKLFRRNLQRRRGGSRTLYIRESSDCIELEDRDDMVECLCLRIRGKASKADILVGISYGPPNEEEDVNELFYKQLADVSQSPAHGPVGNFNL